MNELQLPDGRLICADVFEGLAMLEPESVQCVVTSPPYWGLRKYSGEQERVWGGAEGCEHEWEPGAIRKDKGNTIDSDVSHSKKEHVESQAGSTCLRCGAWRGAYGLEPTPEMWVEHTMEWLRAVRPVLRDDGVVWLNVGSSYSGGGRGQADQQGPKQRTSVGTGNLERSRRIEGYKPLDLVWAAALLYPALLREGWWVRSVIVWAKPNPMPESVQGTRWEQHRVKAGRKAADWGALPKGWDTGEGSHDTIGKGHYRQEGEREATVSEWADCPGCAKCSPNDGLILRKGSWRPTSSYEEILMLAKSPDYFADGEDVREPIKAESQIRGQYGFREGEHDRQNHYGDGFRHSDGEPVTFNPAGRNLRDVWTFPTQPYKGAHFATFPEELVRRCILSSTPKKVCVACGEPWVRVVGQAKGGTIGFRPICKHDAPARPAVVLDPFGGSGTVSVVARSLGRRHAYIDVSEEYKEMARARLEETQPALVSDDEA